MTNTFKQQTTKRFTYSKKYLPSQFSINHVRSHQDKRKKKCNLTTAERLNIAADELVGSTSSRPIIPTSTLNLQYILMANIFLINTETKSGQLAVQMRLGNSSKRNTNGLIKQSIQSNGKLHPTSSLISCTQQDRWLLSNSKATDNNMIFSYCYRSEETLDHDHFLTCNESDERK